MYIFRNIVCRLSQVALQFVPDWSPISGKLQTGLCQATEWKVKKDKIVSTGLSSASGLLPVKFSSAEASDILSLAGASSLLLTSMSPAKASPQKRNNTGASEEKC